MSLVARTTALIAGSIALGLTLASPAAAVTVTIGLQEAGTNGGVLTAVASGAGTANFSGAYGASTFTANNISAFGNPPLTDPGLLASVAADVSSVGAGTLTIYVTSQGITAPVGSLFLTSGLTSNLLPAGWTVVEETFLDTSNTLFGVGTPLAAAVFNAIGTSTVINVANPGAGPYSVTERYTIHASGAGSALSTITISAVPVPAALPLLTTGLFGLFGWLRKRRDSNDVRNELAAA